MDRKTNNPGARTPRQSHAAGNAGSRGQNTRRHGPTDEPSRKQSRDIGDERGPHGGSGGGRGNRQNRAINRG